MPCLSLQTERTAYSYPTYSDLGECFNATPPPPAVIGQMQRGEVVADEEAEEAVEPIASAVRARLTEDSRRPLDYSHSSFDKFKEHPHACLAMSDVATWGSSAPTAFTDTDVPSTADDLSSMMSGSEEEVEFDDDLAVHGGAGNELHEEQEVPAVPDLGEHEECEAQAEGEPARPKHRRHSKK